MLRDLSGQHNVPACTKLPGVSAWLKPLALSTLPNLVGHHLYSNTSSKYFSEYWMLCAMAAVCVRLLAKGQAVVMWCGELRALARSMRHLHRMQ